MSDEPRRTLVPLPGSSGHTPTGAMQFQRDWPGLFIRGDDAIFIAASIREIESRLAASDDVRVGAALARLSKIADIIERDVKARPGEEGLPNTALDRGHHAGGDLSPARRRGPIDVAPPPFFVAMKAGDVIGRWVHECQATFEGRPWIRVNATLAFAPDGTGTLDEHRAKILEGADEPLRSNRIAVRWSVAEGRLYVDFPGRTGSPFEFWMTPSGDIQWYNGGFWRRAAEG